MRLSSGLRARQSPAVAFVITLATRIPAGTAATAGQQLRTGHAPSGRGTQTTATTERDASVSETIRTRT
jgi:hypothetical protein